MSAPPLILASASPRRRRLLERIGLPFEVIPASVDEHPEPGERPPDFARRAAGDKARDVAARHPGRLVLGADTVVEIDGRILGKPASAGDAVGMLRRLSGREHLVHTGLALVGGDTLHALVDSATVRFLDLADRVIEWYVATGEPMDKAGAYAVQGRGGMLVHRVEGSPQTVVGLPLHRLPELFSHHGVDIWARLEPPRPP